MRSVHWEMGRRLLDKVRPRNARKLGPDPGADETVRLWYLASSAYMQAVEQLDGWHFERAVQLFPRDPEILFLAACGREMFSGPQIQSVLASMTLARDRFNLIGDEGDELGKAERLFRQSLERNPKQTEARIRLGRVLGRRGRHQDAIVELRRATMETSNRLLQYDGQMFLGAEAAALDLPMRRGARSNAQPNCIRMPSRHISPLARLRRAWAIVPMRCRRSNPC